MSTSEIWSTATPQGQANAVGRQIGRSAQGGGRVTSRIGYTNTQGVRIIRKWGKDGGMIEEEVDNLDILCQTGGIDGALWLPRRGLNHV